MNAHDRELGRGLGAADVLDARARVGENRLPMASGPSRVSILIGQVKSPLIFIVLMAGGISVALGEFWDAGIIAVVIVVDVLLGFIQEYQAQRTYVALRGLLRPTVFVTRDGERVEVEVWELVPGDLVLLAAGDRIPADGVLLTSTHMSVDEAVITGESEPLAKQCSLDPTAESESARVLMGSTVVTGRGVMRVVATGTSTELGHIAGSLVGPTVDATPLQIRLRGFSRLLTLIVLFATAAILVVGLLAGRPFLEMLRISIILAIAAVPEGLIIAVTVILVLGMRRILVRQGLVKRLVAVETLGSVTVICTDKTGTLTEGRMRVRQIEADDEAGACRTMVLCNNLQGPVDIAVWEFADARLVDGAQAAVDAAQREAEELFTSETKFMITAIRARAAANVRELHLKGAPEIVLAMCDIDGQLRTHVLALIEEWATQGMRLLGVATRVGGMLEEHSGYRWLGLVGMDDPVRPDVPESVRQAARAGVGTKMITGDHRATAESVAHRVGLTVGGVLEGKDVEQLSDEDLRRRVLHTSVFSRIRPQDKLRIVHALQANGEVVAMVGDGVNDAPALAHADIGVVVGSATEVAKESADLVLLDSDFTTIVAAVEEGRVIFDNIRKVVGYVLSNSFAEVLTIFLAMLLGWPAPLLVAQILWIHLICDGPSDIVLGFEPAEPGVMDRGPRSIREPVLDRLGATLIVVISVCSAAFALASFGYFHLHDGDPVHGRSIVFASFAINSMVYIFAYRSMRTPLLRMTPLSANRPLLGAVAAGLLMATLPFLVPELGHLLGLVPLDLRDWVRIAAFSLVLLGVVESAKALEVRRSRHAP